MQTWVVGTEINGKSTHLSKVYFALRFEEGRTHILFEEGELRDRDYSFLRTSFGELARVDESKRHALILGALLNEQFDGGDLEIGLGFRVPSGGKIAIRKALKRVTRNGVSVICDNPNGQLREAFYDLGLAQRAANYCVHNKNGLIDPYREKTIPWHKLTGVLGPISRSYL
jgi:hypothetical protein